MIVFCIESSHGARQKTDSGIRIIWWNIYRKVCKSRSEEVQITKMQEFEKQVENEGLPKINNKKKMLNEFS